MNHWQMIALAYGLTFGAVALETLLLQRRRRSALKQALAWFGTDDPKRPAGTGGGVKP